MYKRQFSNYEKTVAPSDLEVIKNTALLYVSKEYSTIKHLQKDLDRLFKGDDGVLFQFLETEHPLHTLFTQFIKQYRDVKKALPLTKNVIKNPGKDSQIELLQMCFDRAEYYEYSSEQKSEVEKLKHLEKVQFASFEWNKFEIIKVVNEGASVIYKDCLLYTSRCV